MNSLRFCLSGNFLISPSFLKGSFTGFSVQHFEYVITLSPGLISDKKSAINLIEDTLYEMNWFFFYCFQGSLYFTFYSLTLRVLL